MTSKKETAMVPITDYQCLVQRPQEMLNIIRENLGSDRLTERDLTRITVPLGGGTAWTVPTIDGDDVAKDIDGILVHISTPRVYWQTNDMDGSPPDCASPDGEFGVGDPGGECFTCPLNQWGSKSDGSKGKACSEKRMLFVLRPNSLLPSVIQGPTTSIRNIRRYMLHLGEAGLRPWQVVTRFSLEREGKYAYPTAVIIPARVGDVPQEHWPQVKEMAEALQRLVGQVVLTPTIDADNA